MKPIRFIFRVLLVVGLALPLSGCTSNQRITAIIWTAFWLDYPFLSSTERAKAIGAYAKIVTTVVDEDGNPIPDAKVDYFLGKALFKNSSRTTVTTDASGVAVVDELTTGDRISIEAIHPDYYASSEELNFVTREGGYEANWRRWRPKVTHVKLVLRKKVNPIRLDARHASLHFPSTNEWFGVDAELCDWVKPYGKGETSDFEFRFTWNGEEPKKFKEQLLEMRFPEYPNGGELVPCKSQSTFKGVYSASTNLNCQQTFSKKKIRDVDRSGLVDGAFDFPFRIRSVTNSVGEVVSCTYGRFRHLNFSVHYNYTSSLSIWIELNPTPMDNNLEKKAK